MYLEGGPLKKGSLRVALVNVKGSSAKAVKQKRAMHISLNIGYGLQIYKLCSVFLFIAESMGWDINIKGLNIVINNLDFLIECEIYKCIHEQVNCRWVLLRLKSQFSLRF